MRTSHLRPRSWYTLLCISDFCQHSMCVPKSPCKTPPYPVRNVAITVSSADLLSDVPVLLDDGTEDQPVVVAAHLPASHSPSCSASPDLIAGGSTCASLQLREVGLSRMWTSLLNHGCDFTCATTLGKEQATTYVVSRCICPDDWSPNSWCCGTMNPIRRRTDARP